MAWNRRNILQSGVAMAATALAAPFIGRAEAAEPIKVGSLLDLSGPIGTSGQPMYDAIQLAVARSTPRAACWAARSSSVHYDTQSTIQLYSQYAQQLALKDQVAWCRAASPRPRAKRSGRCSIAYKILYFYNVLYEGGVCDRDIFCTGTTPAQTVNKLVPYALKTWGKKVYIVAADYNYGQITAKWMTKYTRDGGGTVQSRSTSSRSTSPVSPPTISKIQEAKPDVVLSALVGSNHTAFYRQWAAAGMKSKIPIASTTFGLVNELATLEASETDGIVTAYGYYEELEDPQ